MKEESKIIYSELIGGAKNTANPPTVVVAGGGVATEPAYSKDSLHFIYGGAQFAAPGFYGCVQLFNPIGSGVTLYVTKACGSLDSAAAPEAIGVHFYNTPLTNLMGNGNNKISGTTASGGVVREDSLPFTPGGIISIKNHIKADSVEFKYKESPLIIGENEGVLMSSGNPSGLLYFWFEWFEE